LELAHILTYPALRFSDLKFRRPLHSLLLFEMVDLSTKVIPKFLDLGFRQKNTVVSVEQSEGDDAQK
jgi:hypothetical protein